MNGFQIFLTSGDNQFGLKKGLGCRNAVYAARNVVDQFIKEAIQPVPRSEEHTSELQSR